jgi:hypothetical protein
MLGEYIKHVRVARLRRRQEYLARIRSELEQEGPESGQMERAAISGVGHQRLVSEGKGLPLRKYLDREFRAASKRAGIDRRGLCIHSLRYTANSTLVAVGVPETVIRARMGRVTAKMTERNFDPGADNGAGTGAVATPLGFEDGAATWAKWLRRESRGTIHMSTMEVRSA